MFLLRTSTFRRFCSRLFLKYLRQQTHSSLRWTNSLLSLSCSLLKNQGNYWWQSWSYEPSCVPWIFQWHSRKYSKQLFSFHLRWRNYQRHTRFRCRIWIQFTTRMSHKKIRITQYICCSFHIVKNGRISNNLRHFLKLFIYKILREKC